MKRVLSSLLVLALTSAALITCDQEEGDGGTGVGVASPSSLPSYEGSIPSDDDVVISALSEVTTNIENERVSISQANGESGNGTWTSQYNETVSGYDAGGTMKLNGNERESWNDSSYNWTGDVSIQLSEYSCRSGVSTVEGVSQIAEREAMTVSSSTGDYSISVLYEFSLSASMSGSDCAGKYILFMSVTAAETGTVSSDAEWEATVNNLGVSGTGYLKIYDNDDGLAREIDLTESEMEQLFPEYD